MNDNDKKILERYSNFLSGTDYIKNGLNEKCQFYDLKSNLGLFLFMAIYSNDKEIFKIIIVLPKIIKNELNTSNYRTILDKNKKKYMSYEDIISKIDANLKLYYDMQKQLLKNKVDRL